MSKQQTKQDTAVPRFTSAARRIRAGIVQQKRRLDERQSSTKGMHVGAHEVLDFSDDEGLDLDYYAYELVRLQTLTEVTIKVFKQPQALIDALDDFKTHSPTSRRSATRCPPGEHGRARQRGVPWCPREA